MSKRTAGPDERLISAALTDERLALCAILEALPPADWDTPSLCEGWTVRDVVGHLVLATHETNSEMIVGIMKARGNFDRMTRDAAIERGRTHEPAILIDQIRSTANSSRRAPMSSPLDPLIDIIVHTQDIVRPLQLTYPPKPEHVRPALDHAVTSRWYGGMKRFSDVALEGNDISWTVGSGGQTVTGKVVDFLLMATGRASGLAALSGPGVEVLNRRLVK